MNSGVFIESIEILLSVKMVAARGQFSVISISSLASSAFVITSCSAWLFEHLLSSVIFSEQQVLFQRILLLRIRHAAQFCSLPCTHGLFGPYVLWLL